MKKIPEWNRQKQSSIEWTKGTTSITALIDGNGKVVYGSGYWYNRIISFQYCTSLKALKEFDEKLTNFIKNNYPK